MPRPPAVTALRPYTAFSWAFPGPQRRVKPVYWLTSSVVPRIAAQATKRMEPGGRVVLTTEFTAGLFQHPQDVCRTPDGAPTNHMGVWPDNGIRATAERFEHFLEGFSAAGGAIDLLVLDQEDGYPCWAMSEARLEAIGRDPAFPALARKLGFDDARRAAFKPGSRDYLVWNAIMGRVVHDATDRAILEPLRRHFPRAGMCNFGAMAMALEHVVPDINSHLQYTLGEPTGTHQAPGLYGGASPTIAENPNWQRPFTQVLYTANWVRAGLRSSGRPIIPWLAYKNFVDSGGGRSTVIGNTDYWEENAWHAMLSAGTTNALYWNPTPPKPTPFAPPPAHSTLPGDNDAMEAVMAQYEQQAKGQAITGPLTADRVAWDATFVMSAVRLADGAVLARVTFAEEVEGARFELAGQSVKVARPAGKVGVWVRLP